MWLIKAHTSQEAPTSTSGSSSLNHEFINSIAIDLASERILDNWLSKFKENGYNVKDIEKRNET